MSALIVVPLYLIAIYIIFSFSRSKESKSAKGELALLKALSWSIFTFPVGWLLMEVYRRFSQSVSLETYRDFTTMLLPITIIVYGISLVLLRKGLKETKAID
ncbi:hypothetical protein [Terribacillus saccharophilus]|uniref:Uncharacterized protein n=1 Tax=Terribacillus saccharophilus TaxID=361277 RepID=A0A268AEL4_9BACI|nr:hypothetical protein [Terribacillus saccharophilus]PAD22554.1 hypothetical protein CHH64_02250 [Terribacillus saccharophilus]